MSGECRLQLVHVVVIDYAFLPDNILSTGVKNEMGIISLIVILWDIKNFKECAKLRKQFNYLPDFLKLKIGISYVPGTVNRQWEFRDK